MSELRCINPNCPAQLERAIEHFASRKAMNIKGLGSAIIKQLVDKGILDRVAKRYEKERIDDKK